MEHILKQGDSAARDHHRRGSGTGHTPHAASSHTTGAELYSVEEGVIRGGCSKEVLSSQQCQQCRGDRHPSDAAGPSVAVVVIVTSTHRGDVVTYHGAPRENYGVDR